ncbi:YbbC/YhhH family protein [Confluentibacter citreus]|uniref:YbbC/YhhH family protein n=1 Tax=Confluentibacter citreus TaxID=2007307 RepID=UPI000C28BAE5|nr:YbbC/YhhH family protein [Confluentibacter citreus]
MKIGIILIIGLLISTNIQAQEFEKKSDDLKHAQQLLEHALKNKSDRTELKFKLIPKKENAVKYAEIILFELYGKEKIEAEKPYKINLINDYWVITGTLSAEMIGGVFEIVFDSWNGKVLTLEHGK